ncbi:MAG: YicC/YloC family endoribonuclease [Pseudomonadota bacterium]
MLNSMTAYATLSGHEGALSWVWELRGVNSKGLDIRQRIPDWCQGVEADMRTALARAFARGNVQVSLKVSRAEDTSGAALNLAAVDAVLAQLREIEAHAAQASVPLAPTRAVDILTLRSVADAQLSDLAGPDLAARLRADIPTVIAAFADMRAEEGRALHAVLTGQLSRIATLVKDAKALLPSRAAAQAAAFRAGMERVLQETDIDENRLAQELAQLAIKSDVMEEIDRLEAHILAAGELLEADEPVGRKLDFLMQEFNREANTLCSKSGDSALTRIGLDLKVAIDQMREQIQNVE